MCADVPKAVYCTRGQLWDSLLLPAMAAQEVSLEVKAGSPLCVASQRLKQRKENVIEQLNIAEKFVSRLCFQRGELISRLDEECIAVDNEVDMLKRALEDKRVEVIKELQAIKKEKLEALSTNIELANVAISNSVKVC